MTLVDRFAMPDGVFWRVGDVLIQTEDRKLTFAWEAGEFVYHDTDYGDLWLICKIVLYQIQGQSKFGEMRIMHMDGQSHILPAHEAARIFKLHID